jgi:hypothetical protein
MKSIRSRSASAACLAIAAGLAGHSHTHAQQAPANNPPGAATETKPLGTDAKLATFAFEGEVRAMTDNRNRGVSDSNKSPTLKASLAGAHASGMIGYLEAIGVSRRVFPNASGVGLTAALGWRGGDPDAWHFGVGLAREQIVGGKLDTSESLDFSPVFGTPPGPPTPVNPYTARFHSNFAVLELGHGNLDGRLLYVFSKNYRGIDSGTLCQTLAGFAATLDPAGAAFGDAFNKTVECYGRPFQNSRGSVLLDLDYKIPLNADQTWITLHAGYQYVPNFADASFADVKIGITHKWSGFEFTAEAVKADTKNRVLFKNVDYSKSLDNATLVLSVAKKF